MDTYKEPQPVKGNESPTGVIDTLAQESLETTAIRLSTAENNSPEWHELRATGIGGSEVAAIVGVSRWESAYSLWAKKTGKVERDNVTSEAAEWGNRLEPVILDKFEEENPQFELIRDVGTWCHPDRLWQRANPDAIAIGEDGPVIIEVKTAQFEDDWVDGPPVYYLTQVQWYMQVFGYRKTIFAVLFHGNKYAEYEVEGSEFEQYSNLAQVEQWREHLLNATAPDFDGSTSTMETVRKMHPNIDPELSVELGGFGVDYVDALHAKNDADERLNLMKSRVMDVMGDAKTGTLGGKIIVTRQARGQGVPYLVNKKGI